jgi:hypothetical protein
MKGTNYELTRAESDASIVRPCMMLLVAREMITSHPNCRRCPVPFAVNAPALLNGTPPI